MKKGHVNFGFEYNRFNLLSLVPLRESEHKALKSLGFTHGYRDSEGEVLAKQGNGRDMKVLRKLCVGKRVLWVQIFPRPKKKKCKGCKNCTCKKPKDAAQHTDA